MRAVVLTKFGPSAEAFQVVDTFPKPAVKPGEVLIETRCAGVNPLDYKIQLAHFPAPGLPKLPKILGSDVSGVVVESLDSKFKAGDRVLASSTLQLDKGTPYGTYAALVAIPASSVALVPPGLSFEEAAATPVAATTAWQSLAPAMPLAGKRVLVQAGAGGVGAFAVQIAKAQGAHVTTTCSGRNADFVTKELGADVVIDYNKAKFDDPSFGTYDVAVDVLGGYNMPRTARLVKKDGHFTEVFNTAFTDQLGFLRGTLTMAYYLLGSILYDKLRLGPHFKAVFMEPRADKGLDQVVELIKQGKVKVFVEKVYPLEEVGAAHDHVATGRTRGKVVMRVKAD